MTTSPAPAVSRIDRPLRRFGYTVAAVVNAVMIWAVHSVVGWDIFGWLTSDFDRLLPWLTASFVAGILLNLAYAWNDSVPVKSPGQILSAIVGLAVTIQTLVIFPFDFSEYGFDYSWPIRIALWVAIVGILVGAFSDAVKLARYEAGATGS